MKEHLRECRGRPKASPTLLCLCSWCEHSLDRPGCCQVRDVWQCPMDTCPDYCERLNALTEDP